MPMNRVPGLCNGCVSESSYSRISVLACLLAAALMLLGGCANSAGGDPPPLITELCPASVPAGSAAFQLEVFGENFTSTSSVFINGSSRPTQFVCSKEVIASIPASDVATSGLVPVTVSFSTNGSLSNKVYLYVGPPNPAPTITSLQPAATLEGSAAFSLTVNGTNFLSSSVVNWNGSPRTTTYVSATQVTAAITAADVATAGIASVTVVNPAPGGGTSNAAPFTINNPLPTITSLGSNTGVAGGPAFSLTVNGTNFVAGSLVNWNGSPRATTFVSATQVTATITPADIATAGTASVTVVNAAPGGGTSNAVAFTIDNPVPTLTSLNPPSATVTGPAFTLTVNGTNFVATSVVNWNGSPRATTFVNNAQLTAAITVADIAAIATPMVTVFNPTPGGGTSNALQFTVNSNVPVLTFISPMSAPSNTPGLTITLTGSGFLPSSVAYAATGSQALTTTYVSPSQLTAQIPAGNLALFTSTPVVNIEVINPPPGGGTSNALPFDTRPFANLTSLNGDYILQFSGFDSIGPVVRMGVVQFAGDGTVLGGVMDTNSQSAGAVLNQAITTGTYTMNLDGTGQLVVNGATYQMKINLFNGDLGSPTPAEQLDIIEFDDANGTGTRGSGTLTKSFPGTAFPTTPAAMAGDYAFVGQGTTTKAQRSGLAGRVTVTANATFSNGAIDVALPGAAPTNISAGLGGSFSDPDATLTPWGRFTIAMSAIGAVNLNVIGYYNPLTGKILFMDVDVPGTYAIYFGQMSSQTIPVSGGWSNGALSTTDLLALTGVSAGGSNIEAGAITSNGAGAGTGAIDQNNAGTITLNAAVTSAYAIPAAGNGRATLSITQGAATRNFTLYMIQQDQAYVLEGTPASPTVSFQTGFLGWGSCNGNCSAASLSPDFGLGTVDPALPGVTNQVGLLVTDGLTNIETVTDQSSNVTPFLQTGVVSDNTYSIDSSGRGTVPGPAAPTFVFWVATGGAVGIPVNAATTNGAVQIIGAPPVSLH